MRFWRGVWADSNLGDGALAHAVGDVDVTCGKVPYAPPGLCRSREGHVIEGETEHTGKITYLQSGVGGAQLPVPGSGLCFLKSLHTLFQYSWNTGIMGYPMELWDKKRIILRGKGVCVCVNERKNMSTAAKEGRIKMEVPQFGVWKR